MSVEVHASLESDWTIGVHRHKTATPTLPPVPIIGASIERPAQMNHLPGAVAFKHKLSSKVTFNDLKIVQTGHDLGPLLDHIVIPMSPLVAMAIIGSSRKTTMSSAQVQVDGKPFAGAQIGLAWLPLSVCGEPAAAPTGVNLLSWRHNLLIGFSRSDIFFGVVGILTSAVMSALFGAAFNSASERLFGRKLTWSDSEDVVAALKLLLGFSDPSGLVKAVVGGALDGALSYARGRVDGTHDWSIKFSVGGPAFQISIGYTGSDDPTRRGWSAEAVRYGTKTTIPLSESLRNAAAEAARDHAPGRALNPRGERS